MTQRPTFIIYAPRYRDNSGGSIVMHKLCDVLNRQGYRACLWPLWKPRLLPSTLLQTLPRTLAYLCSRLYRGRYTTNDSYITPIATKEDLKDAVVVYPEIVSGNPLNVHRYMRWLLHQPGFHEGTFKYKQGDLYFSYQAAFNKHMKDMVDGGVLTIAETFLAVYQHKNTGERIKTCYIVRKGKHRADLPDLKNKWVVDDLSHEELANVFNECRICYLYDTHTAYAAYAAICGCIPVVIPIPGVTKEEWVAEESSRYGVAYGEDDISFALATREALLDRIRDIERRNIESALHFVNAIEQHPWPR